MLLRQATVIKFAKPMKQINSLEKNSVLKEALIAFHYMA